MSNVSAFWDWFKLHYSSYRSIDTALPLQLFQDLKEQLYHYNENLSIGMGKLSGESKEMIITANGNKECFEAAEALIEQAPQIEGWEFVALKPAVQENFEISLVSGIEVNTKDIWFDPASTKENPALFGIRVYVEENLIKEKDSLQGIVSEVVQQMAGEKSFALDIDFIEIEALPENPKEEGFIPIIELDDFIKWYKSQVQKQ